MAGSKADKFFGDPPYNLKIGGHASELDAIQHREFPEASGEMSKDEFTGSLNQSLSLATARTLSTGCRVQQLSNFL